MVLDIYLLYWNESTLSWLRRTSEEATYFSHRAVNSTHNAVDQRGLHAMPLPAALLALSLKRSLSMTEQLPVSRLKSVKQAGSTRMYGNHEQATRNLQETTEVIEISDDDDDGNHHVTMRPHHCCQIGYAVGPFATPDTQHMEQDAVDLSEYHNRACPSRNPIASAHPGTGTESEENPDSPASLTLHDESLRKSDDDDRRRRQCEKRSAPTSTVESAAKISRKHKYPRLHLSFPHGQYGDDRATLSMSHRAKPVDPASRLTSMVTTPVGSSTASPCPYFYDAKLEAKMYRGPGFERFPVVLGTMEGHQETCDDWDARIAKETAKWRSHPHLSLRSYRCGLNETLMPRPNAQQQHDARDARQESPKDLKDALTVVDECLLEVLQIFPQLEHDFVRKMHRDECPIASVLPDRQLSVRSISNDLIAKIAELDTYPRQKEAERKGSATTEDDPTGATIPWDRDTPKNRCYFRDAVVLLAKEFTHVPTNYIYKVAHKKQSLFETYISLADGEIEYYSRSFGPYHRSRHPRIALEKKYQRDPGDARDAQQHGNLVNEIQAARQRQARETDRVRRQRAKDDEEAENLAEHLAQGTMVECQCCFDDKPINRAVPCKGKEVHFFCDGCVERQAESQLGSMKYEMTCNATGGCDAELSSAGIGRALPIQLYDKLARNRQQAEISAAGIEGLAACPYCDFKAICEPVKVDSVFDCQNPDCAKASCRKCNERAHLPRSCEEVKQDKGLDARHAVEEARSEAMMRTCPKCKVKIVKEFGCNKLVCTNCHTIVSLPFSVLGRFMLSYTKRSSLLV